MEEMDKILTEWAANIETIEEEMLDEDEDEEDEDDEEEEDIDEDDEDMDFKMVFVVNKSLELKAGMMSLYVAKSTAGLFKKINAQPQSVSRTSSTEIL